MSKKEKGSKQPETETTHLFNDSDTTTPVEEIIETAANHEMTEAEAADIDAKAKELEENGGPTSQLTPIEKEIKSESLEATTDNSAEYTTDEFGRKFKKVDLLAGESDSRPLKIEN